MPGITLPARPSERHGQEETDADGDHHHGPEPLRLEAHETETLTQEEGTDGQQDEAGDGKGRPSSHGAAARQPVVHAFLVAAVCADGEIFSPCSQYTRIARRLFQPLAEARSRSTRRIEKRFRRDRSGGREKVGTSRYAAEAAPSSATPDDRRSFPATTREAE